MHKLSYLLSIILLPVTDLLDYLHPLPNSAGKELNAGIFKK